MATRKRIETGGLGKDLIKNPGGAGFDPGLPLQQIKQITRNCNKGANPNVDLSEGNPVYEADRLLLLVNPEVVRRPYKARPIGLPPEIMKAFAFMRAAFQLQRVDTIVQTGHAFYLAPATVQPEGLTAPERAALHALVTPLRHGTLPAAVSGEVRFEEAAIEMASRVQLTFQDATKVQAAADFLCTVPNILRVERPACGYATRVSTEGPPPPPPNTKTVNIYHQTWWQDMTAWRYSDLRTKTPSGFDSDLVLTNIAVLDSGIDITGHPCLGGAYTLPLPGDFPFSEIDRYGHGTHVLSIVAGRPRSVVTANGSSLDVPGGVLPNAKVLSFGIFRDRAVTYVDMEKLKTALFAIRHYYTHIKVVNLSIWMAGLPDWDLRDEINKLADAGVVPVVCAGNNFDKPLRDPALDDSSYRVRYPARLLRVLSVGAAARDSSRDSFSRFSTWGKYGYDGNDSEANTEGRWPLVNLMAPGRMIWGAMIANPHDDMGGAQNITELSSKHRVAWMNGTSMAAPMVSAAAGYLHRHWQGAKAVDIRKAVMVAVDKTSIGWQPSIWPHFPVTWTELHGTGVLDFGKVAKLAKTPFQFKV